MHAVVDMCLHDSAHVDDYEFSSTTDLVQFSIVAVSDVPMPVSFDVSTPIVDTIGMSTYGSPAATYFSIHDGDDPHSSPIYIMWVDTGKTIVNRSSTELPSGDILTSISLAQVLGARL